MSYLPPRAGSRADDPGWKYLWIAALEPGATPWTALLETRRLHPDDDETAVTAERLRAVIDRLQRAGHWSPGDPPILIVADSGYDVTRLTWLLSDLPVVLVARVRPNRVFYAPAGKRRSPTKGRGPRHRHKLTLADPESWPAPWLTTTNQTSAYSAAATTVFDRQHQRIECRGPWADHDSKPPIIEGTLTRLVVDHLPGDRTPDPVWLWCSASGVTATEVDHYWSAYLRRFDLEHTFRLLKQTLGWTHPMLRDPQAADRWTWLVLAAHTQLRLARRSPLTTGFPGNADSKNASSRPHESGQAFTESTGPPPAQPTRRKPPDPAPDTHQDDPTDAKHQHDPSERTPEPIKRQAQPAFATPAGAAPLTRRFTVASHPRLHPADLSEDACRR